MINNKKVYAIIMECNPFHDGHKRILQIVKNKYKADIIVVIMAGSFVQRGEPAIFDKYKRATTLIKNGVDTVIELPIEYVLSGATLFSRGAINILDKLGFIDNIVFGSNINNIETLTNISNKLNRLTSTNNILNEDSINNIKKSLKKGLTYPKTIYDILNIKLSPNDILATQYINAINEIKSNILPISIERNADLKGATEIRNKLYKSKNNKYIKLDDFSNFLNYKLFNHYEKNIQFTDYYNINTDFSNAILKTSNKNILISERIKILNTKNRTVGYIKRNLLHILLGITEKHLSNLNYGFYVPYIRIIGIKKTSINLLKYIAIPYIFNFSKKEIENLINKIKPNISKNKLDKILQNIQLNTYATNMYDYIANTNYNESTRIALKI